MNSKISKREFIRYAGLAAGGLTCLHASLLARDRREYSAKPSSDVLWKWSKECFHYEITPRGPRCLICPNECTVKPGEASTCRNRINYKDKLFSIAYGNPCAVHVDPVEKKPLFHFLPGTHTFSIATAGCNFACLNCQNWTISQASPKETRNYDLLPEKVVDECIANDCRSISYTYSEPITFYEYVYDTSKIARQKGIRNIIVSNGYINEKPLRELCKVIDAATIDLKSFNETIYLKLNAGKLQPILNALKIMKEEKIWLEISNLVIPGWSDDLKMIQEMCDWFCKNGFQDVPFHFLRFQPLYKLTQLPPTPIPILESAREIALKTGMKYVYIGNIPGSAPISTNCPKCKRTIIERRGFSIVSNLVNNGKCSICGEKIAGKWD